MEYKNVLARAEIKNLMYKYELTNKECAIMLGISEGTFRNKLSKGSFKLSEYIALLQKLNLHIICVSEDDITRVKRS